ncbi:MAG: T9SS type A sorting domain-containing protein [Bacteroidia bacterium]
MKTSILLTKTILAIGLLLSLAWAQTDRNGTVFAQSSIGNTGNTFPDTLVDEGGFGTDMTMIGDLDGDNIEDMVVGAPGQQNSSNTNIGRVYVMFMNADGTVKSVQKIGNNLGGFTYPLSPGDAFGYSVAHVGDLDNDGKPEIAVGAPGNRQVTRDTGAVYILSLNTDGTVDSYVRIADNEGGMPITLDRDNWFGTGLAATGDIDGDGINDLAVGQSGYRASRGAIYTLLLNRDATVKSATRITSNEGGFNGTILSNYRFGEDVASLGDRDGDGVPDLIVGCWGDNTGASFTGSAFLLFLKKDGSVRFTSKLDATTPRLKDSLNSFDYFGWGVNSIADLDGDGLREITVGATRTRINNNTGAGRLFIIFATRFGAVRDLVTITAGEGNYGGTVRSFYSLGEGMCEMFDVNNDGVKDLALGLPGADGGLGGFGRVDILQLNGLGASTVAGRAVQNNQTGNAVIGGKAYLFDRFDKNHERYGFDTAFTTAINPNGTFSFKKIPNREYLLKMEPDTSMASNEKLVPSYYWYVFPNKLAATRYSTATPLQVLGDTALGDLPVAFRQGLVVRNSFANYGMSYPGRKIADPLSFAPLLVFDPVEDTLVSFSLSDANGEGKIEIPDLQKRYTFVVDFPGLPMNAMQSEDVLITPSSGREARLEFFVDSVQIQMKVKDQFPVGIEDFSPALDFALFPNPASQFVTIRTGQQAIAEIRLHDTFGKLILKKNAQSLEARKINIANLKKGRYFVSIIDKNGRTASEMLIVQ